MSKVSSWDSSSGAAAPSAAVACCLSKKESWYQLMFNARVHWVRLAFYHPFSCEVEELSIKGHPYFLDRKTNARKALLQGRS